jgi:hypothetical protein
VAQWGSVKLGAESGRGNRHVHNSAEAFTLKGPMRWLFAAIVGLFALISLGAAVLRPLSPWTVLPALVALLCFIGARRALLTSIRCDRNGVTAVDLGWSYRHRPWDDILFFEWQASAGVGVRLTDGSFVALMRYPTWVTLSPESATELLNQQKEHFRHFPGTGGPSPR